MNKMSAIIFILNKLNSGSVTTKSLADELSVSTKSIQRYIREIEIAEFPLYNPTKGEYAFVEGFSLEKMKLSDSEACLIVLLKSFVKSLNNKELSQSFDIFKQRVLNSTIDNPFFIKFQKGTQYQVNEITKSLEKSITDKNIINLQYEGVTNKIYNLKPLKIVNFEGFWYLICLGTKNKILKFSIQKIKEVIITDKIFEETKDIIKILKEATTIWFEEKRNINVQLHIDKLISKYFKVKQYFPLQKIYKENKDGSLILNCKISKFEEILPTIFYWLPNIKVIEPKLLNDKIKEILKQY